MLEEIYTSGEYLAKNPTWHIEDSSWKAMQIIRMIAQNHLAPKTICEVGCGAGEILKQLQEVMDNQLNENPRGTWPYPLFHQGYGSADIKRC